MSQTTHASTHADPAETLRAFHGAVNMTAGELETWLATPESNEVGWVAHEGDAESVGHESGRVLSSYCAPSAPTTRRATTRRCAAW